MSKDKTESLVGTIAVLFVLFIIGLWVWNSAGVDTVSEKKQESPTSVELHAVSQLLIENYLKAPSTAEYPAEPDIVAIVSPDVYYVASHVDSQNGFGAMIRTQYEVVFEYKNKESVLVQATIDGQQITK